MHICSFTDFADLTLTTADGAVFRFEFSKRFGPLMLGKRGQTLQTRPPARSPFWTALHAWCQQDYRVESGRCVYVLAPFEVWVQLVGRQYAHVPADQQPRDVRRQWFENAKLPEPHAPVKTIQRPAAGR